MKLFVISALVLLTSSCSDFGNKNNAPNGKQDTCLNCAPPAPKPDEPGSQIADPSQGDFSEEKMLHSLGLNAIYPMTKDLLSQSAKLKTEVQNFCAIATPSETEYTAVQAQWTNTMMAFHKLNAAPVGPLVDTANLLRDNIYAWPAFNPCGIDNEVVRLSEGGATNPALMFTMKGLSGIEYLLFDRSAESQCNPKNPKNQAAVDWRKKSESEKHADRCKLTTVAANDLYSNVEKLESAWNPAQGNFSRSLTNGSRYPTLKDAITAMSDALFAVEYIKDVKLGTPLGLNKGCQNINEKCPESLENKFSEQSVAAAVSQLQGFRTLFTAGGVRGFDEYLKVVGHPEVADHILALVDTAIANGEALATPGLFQQEIQKMSPGQCKLTTTTNRVVPACAFYQDVRALANKMKTEFLTVLSIRHPPTHGGDND